MSQEKTLSIIKPDAVENNHFGAINAAIEASGLQIVECQMMRLSEDKARAFYAEHKERPFYDSLVSFMTSGPVVVQVLSGENAIARYRSLMGATNPEEAAPNTLRSTYASCIERNAVHGSDSTASAAREVDFFFGRT